MKNLIICSGKKLEQSVNCSWTKLACFHQTCWGLISSSYRVLVFQVNPFWIHLSYFITVSLVGYLALKVSNLSKTALLKPKDIDVFFTSVSATTVSSMSTIEMEVFSNTQFVILTILMLVGGEVFTSMLGLQFARFKYFIFKPKVHIDNRINLQIDSSNSSNSIDHIELELVSNSLPLEDIGNKSFGSGTSEDLKYNSIKCLGYVVLGYLLVVHICGYFCIIMYLSFVQSARRVLKNKGLHIPTFSVFTIVSTFTNCGFIPTNENMIVFKKNSGLLLILIPQILLGNTLFAPCLRFVIWVLGRMSKRGEFSYILRNFGEMGYDNLVSSLHSSCLVVTVFGFILVQFVLFCSMEWNSDALNGLNSYQKLVGSLFQVVNSRHTGESVVDLSVISPAILVLFIMMMYFPPYTSFLPIEGQEKDSKNGKKVRKQRKKLAENVLFSQLSYLVIFIILICITERRKMKEDPLNFNVLNITIEVISAYGNVGFSTGYSCERRLQRDNYCRDAMYGFVGRWSNKGKLILILVMFFGRLKKFNMKGGRAWKLS